MMIYKWLLIYFKKPWANFFMLCWYLFLFFLVLYTAGKQQGSFRYLEW